MKNRFRVSLAMLAIFMCVAVSANAHTPILYVEDLKNGTIYLEGGFSDGSSAAGVKIYLVEDSTFRGITSARDKYLDAIFANDPKERAAYLEKQKSKVDVDSKNFRYSDLVPELFEKKLIILHTQLDQYGELILRKPEGNYLIVFDAGPGHVVAKRGPVLTSAEKTHLR